MPSRKSFPAPVRPGKKLRVAAGYQVFISHSSFDKWIAQQLAKEMAALGVKTWLDEKDLAGGDILVQKILKGIQACQEALVLVSPKSLESQWVAFEIGAARSRKKRVTPVLINVPPEALKVAVDLKAIDLNDLDKFLAQLKERSRQQKSRQQRKG